jgi:hypothetical protein
MLKSGLVGHLTFAMIAATALQRLQNRRVSRRARCTALPVAFTYAMHYANPVKGVFSYAKTF